MKYRDFDDSKMIFSTVSGEMASTSKTDKNGKEIFEKDIVEARKQINKDSELTHQFIVNSVRNVHGMGDETGFVSLDELIKDGFTIEVKGNAKQDKGKFTFFR